MKFNVTYTTSSLAKNIVSEAATGANALAELNKEIPNEIWQIIFLQFTYLYLHLADRFFFGKTEENVRRAVCKKLDDETFQIILDSLKNLPTTKVNEYREENLANYYASVNIFTNYKKLHPEKNELLKNTLFWEFGKIIASISSKNMNPADATLASTQVMKSLGRLNLKEFVKQYEASI